MSDIELVIKIPEEIYELCKRDKLHYEDASLLEYSVANGTPLGKIRAEIEEVANQEKFHDEKWALGLKYAINIINKYNAESEE